jgi:serine phosphatase RsbU (regulator of sigma subunit)
VDDLKFIFENQKRELSDSLRYASYIQRALLPSESNINKIIKDSFILFEPRDIVSGDFYWIVRKSNLIYIAVGDCTGHGVPGAFLSVLGISFLNHIVDNQHPDIAASILNILREHVMKALNQTGEAEELKVGIDMGICIINLETEELNFSGAFHPIYVLKPDSQIFEIQGDKMQIGVAADMEQPFTNHVIKLKKNDMIYMFTDGFVDQFGGPYDKKFKYKNFRQLLKDIHNLPLQIQKEKLINAFLTWKGNLQQIDDILIFGIKNTW